jgi:hypothetical protein
MRQALGEEVSIMAVRLLGEKRAGVKFKLVDEKALVEVIDSLDLDDIHKKFLQKNWLHQVVWWDKRARSARWKYFTLRAIIIIVGSVMPALASLNATYDQILFAKFTIYPRLIIVFLSLLIGMCAGLEGLFNFGGIWREKRRAAELLKVEGWRFFQGAGDYKGGHKKAYSKFATRVANIIEQEIEEYTTLTLRDQEDDSEENSGSNEQSQTTDSTETDSA